DPLLHRRLDGRAAVSRARTSHQLERSPDVQDVPLATRCGGAHPARPAPRRDRLPLSRAGAAPWEAKRAFLCPTDGGAARVGAPDTAARRRGRDDGKRAAGAAVAAMNGTPVRTSKD